MIFRDCLTAAHWCFSTLSNTLSRIFNRHVERLLIAFSTELVYYSMRTQMRWILSLVAVILIKSTLFTNRSSKIGLVALITEKEDSKKCFIAGVAMSCMWECMECVISSHTNWHNYSYNYSAAPASIIIITKYAANMYSYITCSLFRWVGFSLWRENTCIIF